MKKQLLNELEKEAPFRQSLKEDIIKEANRSARKQMSWKIWTSAGTAAVALTAFLLMNLNNPKLNQSESAIHAEQKVADIIDIDAIFSFQPQQRLTQNDPEKVSKLKEILQEAIYSTGTVIDTKDYPDGYIDLFTTSDSKYRLNYWVKQNEVVIDEGINVGELTGDAMYKFIQFIIEEGEYKKGVRVVTKNDAERLQSRIEKLEDLPSNFYKENFQRPNYILDVNGKVYFLTIFDDSNHMITDSSSVYTISNFQDEMNKLREKSMAELNNFMEELSWKKGEVLMSTKLDFSFSWNGNMFQVNKNGVMIGRMNDGRVWIDLTETEVETLGQLVRELN